jgi:predicted permease
MRKEVPLIITFTIGIFMILEFFIPHPWVKTISDSFQQWFLIIAAFAIVLGMANIVRVNVHKVQRKAEGWGYNVVTLVALVGMLVVCLVFNIQETVRDSWLSRALGVSTLPENPGKWAFDSFLVPLSATMFSLLAFFIASAAYRAFRVRSLEAGLLLVAAIIVMFGRVPLGQLLEIDGIHAGTISDWILNNPNAAAKRAILMGAAMGIISMGLKIILGLERAYLGGDK